MKRILTLTFAIVMAISVMAADKATAYFSVLPAMTCQNCENKIKTNLRYEKGVKDITTSLSDQVVTVCYDPVKTSPKKIIAAFGKIGYTATTTSAPKDSSKCSKANGKCEKTGKACCKKQKGAKCCGSKNDCSKTKPSGCCEKKQGCAKSTNCQSK